VAEAWKNDPLIHARVTGGLFREAERVQDELLERSIRPGIPLLFLLAGSDRVVDTRVSLAFARGIVEEDVRVEILEGREHEPFNDLGREEVFQMVGDWLEGILSRSRP
jgi:alpha-beta hydrolase superfamily lysophospholipase